MLAFLRKNLLPNSIPIHLIQSDFTAFHLSRSFGLILLPCNTYSTLTAMERRSALSRVRAHLHRGGIFAASLANPALLQHLPHRSDPEFEESFPHPADGEPVQVSSGWVRTNKQLILTWHYDHLLSNGKVERTSATIKHYLEDVSTYLDEFRQAELEILHLLGDFNNSPLEEGAPKLIFILRKPGDNPFSP